MTEFKDCVMCGSGITTASSLSPNGCLIHHVCLNGGEYRCDSEYWNSVMADLKLAQTHSPHLKEDPRGVMSDREKAKLDWIHTGLIHRAKMIGKGKEMRGFDESIKDLSDAFERIWPYVKGVKV